MKQLLSYMLNASMLLLSFSVIAQELPDIIPPSPNASSLAQYIETPVSHYTGIPNIQIPIYSISSKDIQIPIGLSYHARGIKLSDLASSYGLGWSLNAGGTISRQIRGNADDSPTGYLKQTYYNTFFTSEQTRMSAYSSELNGQFDQLPDQFFFSFAGYSGKFIFDRNNNQPILETFDDLKIEAIGDVTSKIEGFIITDANGTKYYFGKSSNGQATATEEDQTLENYTYSNNGVSTFFNNSSGRITSWHLLEIKSYLKEDITFTYELEDTETYRKTEEVAEPSGNAENQTTIETLYFSKARIKQQKIKKITFSNGEVNFLYNTNRNDLRGFNNLSTPKALSSIEVVNTLGQRIKKYNFDYIYSTSTETNNIINFFNQNAPEAKKRLFLDKITEIGTDNSSLPPYQFTYNNITLPSRFSTSHDKWGYYNGENNGDFSVFLNVNQIGGRSIDTVKVQAGILKRIKYPTGGETEYTYESNRAEFPEHLVDHVAFDGNNPVIEKNVVLDKDIAFYNAETKTYSTPFTVGNIASSQLTNQTGTILTAVELYNSACNSYENYDCPYMIRIYNQDNTLYAILHRTSTSIPIAPGNYTLRAISNNPNEDPNDVENEATDFGVSLKWQEYIDSDQTLVYSAGSRIKSINQDDGSGNFIEKNYEYKYPGGTTSGKIFSFPAYYSFRDYILDGNIVREFRHVNHRPANTLTLEQGNHGGYSYVTEYIGNQQSNIGKKEYEFSTYYDTGSYYLPAYHLPNSKERIRGLPLQILDYSYKNGIYEIVKRTRNNYSFVFDFSPNTFKEVKLIVFDDISQLESGNGGSSDPHNYFKEFTLDFGAVELQSTEVTNYYESQPIFSFTENFYDFEKHYNIQSISTKNSNMNKTLTKFYYPQNIISPSSAEQKLINQNRINTPIQIETIVTNEHGSQQLSKTKQFTSYNDIGNNLVLPKLIKTQKDDNILENRIEYHKYDDKGNPLELSKTNGTYIAYVWGYDQKYPIAKIENATYADIEALPEFNTGFNITENLSPAQETALRALPNTFVSTYIYKPLVGVTSITDPRGYTMTYEYDEFNRLKYVKDSNGDLISENQYHYKGQ